MTAHTRNLIALLELSHALEQLSLLHQRARHVLELVILLPALFAVMFLGMQAALYYHARTVAIAAAQEGARAAGAEQGASPTASARPTTSSTRPAATTYSPDTSTSANRTATTATVTVSGFSLSVIPGWKVRITQSATVPVERLTVPPQRTP